ncbi:hypothetical protein [Helicobacter suis]|uniref:hypothetical protein n=1 Tax=Helicobacter suis TaxID=104628 RepID=UPI002491E349|nr:hypothetical protein [Helicobacter suis]
MDRQNTQQALQTIFNKTLKEIKEVLASSFNADLQVAIKQERAKLEKEFNARLQEKDQKIANQRKHLQIITAKLEENQKQIVTLKQALEEKNKPVANPQEALKNNQPEERGHVLALEEKIARLEKIIKVQNYRIEGQRNLILSYQEQYEDGSLPWIEEGEEIDLKTEEEPPKK